MADTFISAQEAARRMGFSTGALAKRRYLKKAPNGWIYISSNADRVTGGSSEKLRVRGPHGTTRASAPAHAALAPQRRSPMNDRIPRRGMRR